MALQREGLRDGLAVLQRPAGQVAGLMDGPRLPQQSLSVGDPQGHPCIDVVVAPEPEPGARRLLADSRHQIISRWVCLERRWFHTTSFIVNPLVNPLACAQGPPRCPRRMSAGGACPNLAHAFLLCTSRASPLDPSSPSYWPSCPLCRVSLDRGCWDLRHLPRRPLRQPPTRPPMVRRGRHPEGLTVHQLSHLLLYRPHLPVLHRGPPGHGQGFPGHFHRGGLDHQRQQFGGLWKPPPLDPPPHVPSQSLAHTSPPRSFWRR